jgi:hypothetical protein
MPGVLISSPPDLSSGDQPDDARRSSLPQARIADNSLSGIEIMALMIMMLVLAVLAGIGIRLLS